MKDIILQIYKVIESNSDRLQEYYDRDLTETESELLEQLEILIGDIRMLIED